VGGVNEKIEGFFDVCQELGFSGDQGVIIPSDNVQHLMLRHDIVDAVTEGKFHINAVETVEQALSLLSDLPVGELNADKSYPHGSFHHAVAQRINHWAQLHKQEHGEQTH
jgi:predicted ATP-dependent protease